MRCRFPDAIPDHQACDVVRRHCVSTGLEGHYVVRSLPARPAYSDVKPIRDQGIFRARSSMPIERSGRQIAFEETDGHAKLHQRPPPWLGRERVGGNFLAQPSGREVHEGPQFG
jgi:hypothetical protein